MKQLARNIIFIIFSIFYFGCSTASLKISSPPKLRFISDDALSSSLRFEGQPLGGLSGIVFDSDKKLFWVISDNGGKDGPPRLYQMSYQLTPTSFQLVPLKTIFLKNNNEQPFKLFEVDYEGIVLIDDQLILSDEGNQRLIPSRHPHISRYSLEGVRSSNIPIPELFLPKRWPAKGIRNNQGFEALAYDQKERFLISANETSLNQDGALADEKSESYVRLVLWKHGNNGDFAPGQQFAYTLGPIPYAQKNDQAVIGLVELISLHQKKFLSLERTWNPRTSTQSIRIFLIDTQNASNIENIASLAKVTSFIPVKKQLILDLNDILPLLKKHHKLDNIEGFCLGPKLENGNNTLILIGDNNFSQKQVTQVIAFEIIPQ